jgi:predicted amidophosphoribosyltransferase
MRDSSLNPHIQNLGRPYEPPVFETSAFRKSLATDEIYQVTEEEKDGQICQSCKESFMLELSICPFCGYSLDENIRIQKESTLRRITNIKNLIYWYKTHPVV